MIKHLIFDLDGTLFDTKKANAVSYVQAFADVGATITEEQYNAHFGLRFAELANQLAPALSHTELRVVKEKKTAHYKSNVDLIKPNLFLFNLIDELKPTHSTALATTASKQNVIFVLEHFKYADRFDVIVTGEQVKHGKPDPECYHQSMQLLSAKPSESLIFEDSEVGLRAAEASGASVIKVAI